VSSALVTGDQWEPPGVFGRECESGEKEGADIWKTKECGDVGKRRERDERPERRERGVKTRRGREERKRTASDHKWRAELEER
jgi:hypothetical protein